RVDLREHSGPNAVYTSTIHFLTLLKQFMEPSDFLIPAHREKFEKKWTESSYGRYTGIKAVHPTNREEEVFCAVEPETHTFVVGNGVLTSNCYGNSFAYIYYPFRRI